MSFLLTLLTPSRVLLSVFSKREMPEYKGFAEDAKNLNSDWRNVGNDMRKALKDERKSANQSAR